MSKIYIGDKILRNCFTIANYFTAVDVPAAWSKPPEPPHHTDSEQDANKETKTSRSIITYILLKDSEFLAGDIFAAGEGGWWHTLVEEDVNWHYTINPL